MNLLKDLGLKGRILENEPLSRHTSLRIGGPAVIWAQPEDADDIRGLLEISKAERGLPVFLIGQGTNLLVSDEGFKGIAMTLGASFQAGRALQKFIINSIDAGYSGLEFMAGIPGTIGGAVRMNAGAGKNGPWISDFIESLKVISAEGRIEKLSKRDLKFGYRKSGLKDFIILEAGFNLKESRDKESCRKEYRRFLNEKREKQELSSPSAGCVFKNPAGSNPGAGQLIEGCGLKGKRIGDAVVSMKHANFILNTGRATFNDVMELIGLIRSEVLKKYGLNLETEVEILK